MYTRGLGIISTALLLIGCGAAHRSAPVSPLPSALLAQARPIGRGPQFHPPVTGGVGGECHRRLGPRIGAHVEVFAANRVVIVPAGVGVRAPVTLSAGRIVGARCFGDLVTLEPTGVVLVRPARRARLVDLFRAWGQPLSPRRLGPFRAPAGTRVAVFLDGHAWRGQPGEVPLARHAEIVLEVGPHVPPHAAYTFPPGA